jgi:thiol-disulfide isomerase/thioredoxin
MKLTPLVLSVVLYAVGFQQVTPMPVLTGRLDDHLVAEGLNAVAPLQPSSDRNLPGVKDGDVVFRANLPQFRPQGAPNGLPVALVLSSAGGWLFVDANVDGQLAETERVAYTSAAAVDITVTPARSGAVPLPFRCRVATVGTGANADVQMHFTAAFRVEGTVTIGGKATRVSLPFNYASDSPETRLGRLGLDANGDGVIDMAPFVGPEVAWTQGKPVNFRAGDHVVSIEAADFASRTVMLREHAATEYTYFDLRTGVEMLDFTFTDFGGTRRKLSDYRGKVVLLDFWGTWCGPCIAEIPMLREAYDQYRDRGFEIIGMDVERGASIADVRAFIADKGIRWPNAQHPTIREFVEGRLQILGYPTTILIDRNGVIADVHPSTIDRKSLLALIDRAIQK